MLWIHLTTFITDSVVPTDSQELFLEETGALAK